MYDQIVVGKYLNLKHNCILDVKNAKNGLIGQHMNANITYNPSNHLEILVHFFVLNARSVNVFCILLHHGFNHFRSKFMANIYHSIALCLYHFDTLYHLCNVYTNPNLFATYTHVSSSIT